MGIGEVLVAIAGMGATAATLIVYMVMRADMAKRPAPGVPATVQQAIDGLAAVIGEKLVLGRVAVFDGTTTVYLHRRASDLPPSVGVLVEYTGANEDAARGAAMQVAAMRPQYLSREQVPADVVEGERRIAEATAKEEGKPEAALPKIVDGRVTGFFKQVVLLEQVAELAHRGLIGHGLAPQVDAHKLAHRDRLVEGLLHGRIGQVEPLLHEVHAQHALQPHRRAPVARLGIDRLDERAQRRPRHHRVHLGQKCCAAGGLGVLVEAGQRKGRLFHPGVPCRSAVRDDNGIVKKFTTY